MRSIIQSAVIIIFFETTFLSDVSILAVMDMSKAMLPTGLMTTNSEREDFNKSLINVSEILNVLLNTVAKLSIDLLRDLSFGIILLPIFSKNSL